jgi:ABC-type polysaccharide/polyol phosphate transport system ATPase subunit
MANDRIMSLKEFAVKKITGKIKYKEFPALKNINFHIKKGEVVGIIGSNGAGKSTLLKIISGILAPSTGRVKVNGTIAPMLELGAGFDMDLTARENIFLNGAILGYSRQYLMSKYDEIVQFSELEQFMDMPIRNFSSGMTMRLAFSIATLVNPDILIVDEILSVGDAHFQKKSARRMHDLINGGATVILVSHSLEQIRQMCSRVIWLDHGAIRMIGSTYEVCNSYISNLQGNEADTELILKDNESYKSNLYSPTQIIKHNDYYFIVDCWHHRIIYNRNISDPISLWETLNDDLSNPHSIAFDGDVYLVDDTEKNTLKVFKRIENNIKRMQSIGDTGLQPHKIIYSFHTHKFYCIASSSQQLFVLKNVDGMIVIDRTKKLEYLQTSYVRSISIIDNCIYFVSGPNKIIVADLENFSLISEYNVPFDFQGMNDIIKIGSYFYISVYQNGAGEISPKLIRVKNLEQLEKEFEDISEKLDLKGVPYCFSTIDGRFFLTEIDSYSRIISFDVIDDEICDLYVHYDSGPPNSISLRRRNK